MPKLPAHTLQPTDALQNRTIPVARGYDRPINILHPVHSLTVGGLENQLAAVVNGLPRDQFRHVVVVQNQNASTATVEINDHVKVIRAEGNGSHFSQALAQIIDREQIDLLHIRGLSMLVDSVIAARLMRDIMVVASFHGFESNSSTWTGIRRKLVRESLHRCQRRWSVSASAAKEAERRLNLPDGFFETIPNGVCTQRFQPASNRNTIRRALDLNEDGFIFLSVGNLKLIKGHDYLLRAFARLQKAHPANGANLVLVGDDCLQGQLQQLAVKLDISKQIRFVGRIENPLAWYQAADAFVLPSLAEGHSNALLEAMSCGLPTIATRVGGNIDTINNQTTGLLVPPADAAALACAMATMLSNSGLRNDLANGARNRAISSFSQAAMLDRYAAGYRQVLSTSQRHTAGTFNKQNTKTEAATS